MAVSSQPDYAFIARALQQRHVIPFLRSAASFVGVESSQDRLPAGPGLAKELSDFGGAYPGKPDDALTKIAQYCEEVLTGRTPVHNFLRERFHTQQLNQQPNPTSLFLASLDTPLQMITTNYDPHVEMAYQQRKKPYAEITHVTNPDHPKWGWVIIYRSDKPDELEVIEPSSLLLSDFEGSTVIHKMHGTFSKALTPSADTLVITENDYIDFLVVCQRGKFPPALKRTFQDRHFLFLGYALA